MILFVSLVHWISRANARLQKVIKDTFNFEAVPTEAYRIGLAGVLPYLATSTATVLCAFEYNNAAHMGGMGYFLSEKTAELFLHVLEPLQVGYGAVVRLLVIPRVTPAFNRPKRPSTRFSAMESTNSLDPLLPRCYPLGPRMGSIWRPWGIQALRNWRDRPRSRLAHRPLPR